MLKAEIIGHIGSDAWAKELSEKQYISFNLAHTEYQRDEQGAKTEHTTWVSILWPGDGRGLLPYLKKGTKVFVRGNLKAKTYSDRDGTPRVALNINASEVQICSFKHQESPHQTPMQGEQPSQSKQRTDLPF